MIMTAQEARDKVEAGRLSPTDGLDREWLISMAVFNLGRFTQVAITGEYKMHYAGYKGLNELGL